MPTKVQVDPSEITLAPPPGTTVRRKKAVAPFSWGWVWASFAGFVIVQVILGGLAGQYLLRGYHTMHTGYLIEGAINLGGYYLGGFVIGFISPRIRLMEPAVAAFLAMFACMSVGLFTPYVFYQFGMNKFLIGGGIAAFLAYCGAFSAEKFTGQVREEDF